MSIKLEIVKHVYSRPTTGQAITEMLKDYIRTEEREGKTATVEALADAARDERNIELAREQAKRRSGHA